ncbi:MAG: DNA mismatch repair endonuclease MutL, partial [Clostridiales bacterium]|nr:DNA mismatch repair endonuclease MutL [Clostridiales bacterium]
SKVEVFTKNEVNDSGSHLKISGGKVTEHIEAGCPPGTTIVVRDIFYNTPARMKFLKKDATEGGYTAEVVEHIALSKPDISIKLIKDHKTLFQTPGDRSLKSAIYAVCGKEFTSTLVSINSSIGNTEISGYVSKPADSRGNRSMQMFFVNGRHVKSKLLQAALEGAYKNRLLTGRYPSCVINIKIPFSAVDVNVHPAKTEIKFSDEHRVFETVYTSVKTALDSLAERPEIVLRKTIPSLTPDTSQYNTAKLPEKPLELTKEMPAVNKKVTDVTLSLEEPLKEVQGTKQETVTRPLIITAPERDQNPSLNAPELISYSADVFYELPELKTNHSDFTGSLFATKSEAAEELKIEEKKPDGKQLDESFQMIGEIFYTYILVEDQDGLLIIDKHAAHERIIFDELKIGEINMQPQLLLTPEVISVNGLESEIIREHIHDFNKIGFDMDEFGENSFIIRQIPPYTDPGDT